MALRIVKSIKDLMIIRKNDYGYNNTHFALGKALMIVFDAQNHCNLNKLGLKIAILNSL